MIKLWIETLGQLDHLRLRTANSGYQPHGESACDTLEEFDNRLMARTMALEGSTAAGSSRLYDWAKHRGFHTAKLQIQGSKCEVRQLAAGGT